MCLSSIIADTVIRQCSRYRPKFTNFSYHTSNVISAAGDVFLPRRIFEVWYKETERLRHQIVAKMMVA